MIDASAYWASIAQLVAVLLLAFVVEVRAIMRTWSALPKWVRWLQGGINLLYLGGAVFVLGAALQGSRGSPIEVPYIEDIAQSVIYGMVAVLVVNPFITIALRSFPEVFVPMLAGELQDRMRLAVLKRQRRRAQQRIASLYERLDGHAEGIQSAASANGVVHQRFAALRKRVSLSDMPDENRAVFVEEIEELENGLRADDHRLQSLADEISRLRREVAGSEAELRQLDDKDLGIRSHMADLRRKMIAHLVATEDVMAPPSPKPPRYERQQKTRPPTRRALGAPRLSTRRPRRRS